MKNNYWMKLWFDILRDPKMGMLPDRLWRRVIELFLIAGQEGDEGYLPDVPQIAWQLNKPVSAIVTDLQKIADTGIVVEYEPGKWMVTNFKKRNEPVDPTKRIKDFRMRERYENSNEDVTQMKRECNAPLQVRYQEEQKNRRTDKEGKEEEINSATSAFFEPAKLFQAVTGMGAIPASQIQQALPALETLWYQHDKNADKLTAYLKPYFEAWTKRKSKNGAFYSKSNCSWLYDWAIAGEIPTNGNGASGSTKSVNPGLDAVKAEMTRMGMEFTGIFAKEENNG